MRPRLVGPIVGLLAGTLGAWCFLRWSDWVTGWLPNPLVSGAYNSILFLIGGSFSVLLLRILRREELPAAQAGDGLRLNPMHTVRFLGVIAAALVWINALDYLLKRSVEYEYRKVMPLFALEMEGNLPTLFSAMLLLACSLLLALVARVESRGDRERPAWIALACLFAFLALDEAAGLHERLVPLGKSLLSGSGFFAREWIVVYGLLLIPLGLTFVPFLRRLPGATRRIWLLSAVVFLAGAAGLELLAGWYGPRATEVTLVSALLNIAKEALEMTGVLLFLYGLLDHIEREIGSLGVLPVSRRD